MAISKKREALSERLIEAAQIRITRDGAASLRARDLAKDAGVALGSIYNVFEDMAALVMRVNAITFHELGAHIYSALQKRVDPAPEEQIVTMALAYLDFAQLHHLRWQALFETPLTAESEIPDWYQSQIGQLFEIISTPLRLLRSDLDEDQIDLMTRGLFAAVHGIVLLNVQNRVSGAAEQDVGRVIELVLRSAIRVLPK